MGTYLAPADLAPFITLDHAKAAALIEDAEVYAAIAAPPLAHASQLTAVQRSQVRAILRRAVLRQADAGSGALSHETAGPYSYTLDTRRAHADAFLTDAEKDALRAVVGLRRSTQAFTVDLLPGCGWDPIHAWLAAEGE